MIQTELTAHLREGFLKKVAVLLDFVQMREGVGREGPAQIFCPIFTICILSQFWDGEGGGDPCPNFFGTLVRCAFGNCFSFPLPLIVEP